MFTFDYHKAAMQISISIVQFPEGNKRKGNSGVDESALLCQMRTFEGVEWETEGMLCECRNGNEPTVLCYSDIICGMVFEAELRSTASGICVSIVPCKQESRLLQG
jgi:hypothetical protein